MVGATRPETSRHVPSFRVLDQPAPSDESSCDQAAVSFGVVERIDPSFRLTQEALPHVEPPL
jgi:hypothetical protein